MQTIYSIAQNTMFPTTIGSYPTTSVTTAIEAQARYGIHFPSTGEIYAAKLHNIALPVLEAFSGIEINSGEILITRPPTIKSADEVRELGLIKEVKQAHDKIKKLLESNKYPSFRGLKVSLSGPNTLIHSIYNDSELEDVELLQIFSKGIENLVEYVIEAGAEVIQIDEPFLARSERYRAETLNILNIFFQQLRLRYGSKTKYIALHACHKHSSSLFEKIVTMPVNVIDMEFMEFSEDHFTLVENNLLKINERNIGIGVVSGHSEFVESDQSIKNHIYRILKEYEPQLVLLKPDCALKNLNVNIAEHKLKQIQFARKTALSLLGIEE